MYFLVWFFDVVVPVPPHLFKHEYHILFDLIPGDYIWHLLHGAGIGIQRTTMGNSDDDEDSDSDIEQMFQQAHALKQKQRRSIAPSDDEDNDDDPARDPCSSRRKKSKTDRVSIQIALRTEQQHQKDALNARRIGDSDLLEDEDDDPNAELEANRIAAATILIDDDDSSDTERAQPPPVTRPAVPTPQNPVVTRLRPPPNADILALDPPPPRPGPTLLRLHVVCTIRSSSASIPDSVTTCTVDIIETATVQTLMDRILTHYLQRNPQTNVMGLQYQQHTLHPRQTLDMYNLPERNATIQATIHSSDHVLAPAAPKKNAVEGPSVVLILRRVDAAPGKSPEEEDRWTMGTQQPLQVLVEQYAQRHHIPSPSQISLHFDGDALHLQKTPAFYDMDADDLIDVQVAKPPAAPVAARRPKGPSIVLILRRADPQKPSQPQETRLPIGKQQALQVLVQQYAQMHGICAISKISLYFDGDRLNLQTTPAQYDMDEEDLIDVTVAP
jgi:Ubiquitin-2 like Rad60 SUMO-like